MRTPYSYVILFFQIILITTISNGQYVLKPAFPNLPGFSSPLEIVNAGDGSNRLFVVEQKGKIYTFQDEPNVSTKRLFIDLSSIVTQVGGDRGLLGLAFHPDYETNRYFYVYYIADSTGSPSGQWTFVSRFTASESDPDTALNSTHVRILTVSQPHDQHKAGRMQFGPDGYLYISLGDGGRFQDPDGFAQSKTVLLGKVLRINIDSSSGGKNYSIPPTNPFFENPFGWREEIFAYGFRNMWKFSIDHPTGRIFGADVGQFAFEEVNLVESGKNYGWNKMEGFHCFPDTNNCDTTGKNFTLPVLELRRNVAVSSIGGYVYRGSLLPELYGKYVFGDWYYGKVWAMDHVPEGTSTYSQLIDSNIFIPSFGVNESNELYVCSFVASNAKIYRMHNANTITLDLKVILEGLYDQNNNVLRLKDSVDVILHSAVFPNPVFDSTRVVIDSLTFSALCFFRNAPSGNYYISVKFRNGLETWSKSGGEIFNRGEMYSYDFTTDSSMAYGNNLNRKGNTYLVYSGDLNKDRVIDAEDQSRVDNSAFAFETGYIPEDINGDSFVDGTDLMIISENAGNFISTITP